MHKFLSLLSAIAPNVSLGQALALHAAATEAVNDTSSVFTEDLVIAFLLGERRKVSAVAAIHRGNLVPPAWEGHNLAEAHDYVKEIQSRISSRMRSAGISQERY